MALNLVSKECKGFEEAAKSAPGGPHLTFLLCCFKFWSDIYADFSSLHAPSLEQPLAYGMLLSGNGDAES